MDGDILIDEDHVLNHCSGLYLDDDKNITSAAFKLKIRNGVKEEYLSVSWLEFFSGSFEEKFEKLKAELSEFRTIKDFHKFGMLNIGHSRRFVYSESGKKIDFIHKPRGDDSHSGIFGIDQDEMLISELLFDSLINTLSAK